MEEFKNIKPKSTDHEKLFAAKEAEISALSDTFGPGEGIDTGIKETIVVLNLNGIPTIASCEGHQDEREHGDCHYPWVLIGTSDPEKILEVYELTAKYLRDFYLNRRTNEDIKLKVTTPSEGEFYLESVLDNEEKKSMLEKLPKRQQEMRDFTEFLKSSFFAK
jgi:hypothetical protein